MARTLCLVVLLAAPAACTSAPPVPTTPPQASCFGFGPWDSRKVLSSAPSCVSAALPGSPPRATGETLFTLGGGPLGGRMAVPLWLAASDDPDETCREHDEWFFFQVPDGRVYVAQYNPRCGGREECRILDPAARRFTAPPAGCIPSRGLHRRARGLGGRWIEVHSESEGVAVATFARWTPEEPFQEELVIDLGGSGQVEAAADGEALVLRSPCDLAGGGCEASRDYSGAASRPYRWTRAGGVRRLE